MADYGKCWGLAPDPVLLQVFAFLGAGDLMRAGQTCETWCRLAYDELLWKRLFCRDHGLDLTASIAPGE